jgi:hypothetical protein
MTQMEEQAHTRLSQQEQDFKRTLSERQKEMDQLKTTMEWNRKSHASAMEDLELKHSKEVTIALLMIRFDYSMNPMKPNSPNGNWLTNKKCLWTWNEEKQFSSKN